MSTPIHNPYDPICPCQRCCKNREEQMAKLDAQAQKRRQEEVVVELALRAQRPGA